MGKALALLVLALLLEAEPDAWAQPAAGAPAGPPPVFVQSCFPVLTAYGFVPFCMATPVDPNELNRRVTDYLSNGAGVLAVPSAGPGAAYFHDGARVLAAPTTSWIPTFPPAATASSATTPAPYAVAPAVDAGAQLEPPLPEPSAEQAETTRSAASWTIEETPPATPSSLEAPSPSATSSGDVSGESADAAAPGGAAAVAAPPSPVPAPPPGAAPGTTVERTAPGPVVQPWWGAVFAGVVVAAGAVFVIGSRMGRRLRTLPGRARRTSLTGHP